jgi:hypothetical protein
MPKGQLKTVALGRYEDRKSAHQRIADQKTGFPRWDGLPYSEIYPELIDDSRWRRLDCETTMILGDSDVFPNGTGRETSLPKEVWPDIRSLPESDQNENR